VTLHGPTGGDAPGDRTPVYVRLAPATGWWGHVLTLVDRE
jgi:hypothetical protein